MKSVAFEYDTMQTKWLRTCSAPVIVGEFQIRLARFSVADRAVRYRFCRHSAPATNDPICSPPPAAVHRSKLICAGDNLSRTPRPAPPSKATLCCCRRNRDPFRRAPADTRCRAARISPGSFERSAYRPTGLSPKIRVSITVVVTANTVQKERSYRRLFSASSLEFSIEKME